MPGMDHRLFLAQDYALINPMQVALDQRSDLETVVLLPKNLERHIRMMPLLLELKSLPESERLALLDRADRWSRDHDMPLFCAMLAGDTDMPGLERHLLRNMLLSRTGAVRAWLRFHDPRVFRHLRWLLDDEQMCRLMGPVAAWTWFDPLGGNWHVHQRPGASDTRRLQLTREQWDSLEQFEALNRCLRDLAEKVPDPPDDGVVRQLMEGLKEAQRQGLQDVVDKSMYARQRLLYGPAFHAAGDLQVRSGRMKQGGTSCSAASADVESRWLRKNG